MYYINQTNENNQEQNSSLAIEVITINWERKPEFVQRMQRFILSDDAIVNIQLDEDRMMYVVRIDHKKEQTPLYFQITYSFTNHFLLFHLIDFEQEDGTLLTSDVSVDKLLDILDNYGEPKPLHEEIEDKELLEIKF